MHKLSNSHIILIYPGQELKRMLKNSFFSIFFFPWKQAHFYSNMSDLTIQNGEYPKVTRFSHEMLQLSKLKWIEISS